MSWLEGRELKRVQEPVSGRAHRGRLAEEGRGASVPGTSVPRDWVERVAQVGVLVQGVEVSTGELHIS